MEKVEEKIVQLQSNFVQGSRRQAEELATAMQTKQFNAVDKVLTQKVEQNQVQAARAFNDLDQKLNVLTDSLNSVTLSLGNLVEQTMQARAAAR